MPKQDRYCLATLRSQLLDHPVYAEVASVEDLKRFMEIMSSPSGISCRF
jgi:hypothetical protein